jgi:hypothetical protein
MENGKSMTPQEQAHKLHMRYYLSLPNNGGQTGIVSIPVRWKEGLECSIIAVEAIMDFMQMDDELNDDCHFANSRWVNYWVGVKEELKKKLEETKNE